MLKFDVTLRMIQSLKGCGDKRFSYIIWRTGALILMLFKWYFWSYNIYVFLERLSAWSLQTRKFQNLFIDRYNIYYVLQVSQIKFNIFLYKPYYSSLTWQPYLLKNWQWYHCSFVNNKEFILEISVTVIYCNLHRCCVF